MLPKRLLEARANWKKQRKERLISKILKDSIQASRSNVGNYQKREIIGKSKFAEAYDPNTSLSPRYEINGLSKKATNLVLPENLDRHLKTLKFNRIPTIKEWYLHYFSIFLGYDLMKQNEKRLKKIFNTESDWKRDLLTQKLIQYYDRLYREDFKRSIEEVEKEFPKSERESKIKKINEVKEKHKQFRKQLLNELGVENPPNFIPGLIEEKEFIDFVNNILISHNLSVEENYLDDESRALEDKNLFESFSVDHEFKKAYSGAWQYMIKNAHFRKYMSAKRELFKETYIVSGNYARDIKYILNYGNKIGEIESRIRNSFNAETFKDSLVEIFSDVKNRREFVKLYRTYRKLGIYEILEEHEKRNQLLSIKELERTRKSVPNETFPDEILLTDSLGNTYQIFNLETPSQLKYEGSIIENGQIKERHCIGRDTQDYQKKVLSGEGVGFSVRKNGVDGEILYTMWYEKKEKKITQIKGNRNSLMQDVDSPEVQATLIGLGKLMGSGKYDIKEVNDISQLLKNPGEFLIYEDGEVRVKNIHDLSGEMIILSGKINIDLSALNLNNLNDLEKLVDKRKKVSVEFVGEWSKIPIEVLQQIKKIVLNSNRKDIISSFLNTCNLSSVNPIEMFDEDFSKMLILSDGGFLRFYLFRFLMLTFGIDKSTITIAPLESNKTNIQVKDISLDSFLRRFEISNNILDLYDFFREFSILFSYRLKDITGEKDKTKDLEKKHNFSKLMNRIFETVIKNKDTETFIAFFDFLDNNKLQIVVKHFGLSETIANYKKEILDSMPKIEKLKYIIKYKLRKFSS